MRDKPKKYETAAAGGRAMTKQASELTPAKQEVLMIKWAGIAEHYEDMASDAEADDELLKSRNFKKMAQTYKFAAEGIGRNINKNIDGT